MEASFSAEEVVEARKKAAKPMLWIGIVGIVMLFAGLTSAYIVRQAEGDWLYFDLPQMFYVSTAVIVFSSATMTFAQYAIRKNQLALTKGALAATLAAGVAFCLAQLSAWGDLVDMGVFFAGRESNPAGSFLYVLSGVHLLHLGGGVIALIITTVKSWMNRYSAENHLGIELAATYWHFLDILWIYLLLFLLFIR